MSSRSENKLRKEAKLPRPIGTSAFSLQTERADRSRVYMLISSTTYSSIIVRPSLRRIEVIIANVILFLFELVVDLGLVQVY